MKRAQPIDKFQGKYRFLSNFWMCPNGIQLDDYIYPSTEHAYQAAKTLYDFERLEILRAKKPGEAKRLGKKVTMREDWDDVKVNIMRGLLRQKFSEDANVVTQQDYDINIQRVYFLD